MLAGVSTRRYERTGEPVGEQVDERARSTSKSAVSRELVSRTRGNLVDLMARPLGELRLAALMFDRIELKGRCCVVALGIATDGVKHPHGLWDSSTENAAVATMLRAGLVERCLDTGQGVLVVLDSAKALRKAVRDVLGVHTPVQRCVHHESETCSSTCPSATRPRSSGGCVRRGCSTTTLPRSSASKLWPASSTARTWARRRRYAKALTRRSPSPALGVRGDLRKTLASTNACGPIIECVRRTARNVKRWQSGDVCLRWTAAGVLETEQQFRRVIGHRDLAKLAVAVERDIAPHTITHTPAPEIAASPA